MVNILAIYSECIAASVIKKCRETEVAKTNEVPSGSILPAPYLSLILVLPFYIII